jgi:Holliday junction resolvase-like predicted endonuclease|tara:strand:- start:1044 stop:1481 length:438 start_codon:yes stop_codon:yes gene_type:complete
MAFTQRVGRAGEYLAASYLIRHFEEVFEASSSSRYDFLAQSAEESYKIQVKTTESPFKHHSSTYVRWDMYKKVNKTKKTYAAEEVDIFAFVYLPDNVVEFVANYKVGKKYQKKVEYLDEIDTLKSLRKSITIVDELKNAVTKTTV